MAENFLIEVDWLRRQLHIGSARRAEPTIEFTLVFNNERVKGTNMAYTMMDDGEASVVIRAVDAKGNPAPLDGIPAWSTSDDTLLTVTPAVDGLSAQIAAVGPLGATQLKVTADARMGPEVVEIMGVLDIDIVAGEAVSIVLEPTTV